MKNGVYLKILLWVWVINFNLLAIIIEVLAFYLYFVVSFNVGNIYIQVYKLVSDLAPMVEFVPISVWCVLAWIIFDKVRKGIAYKRLNHFERRNRGFINERPIVLMVCGTMGCKKTTAITDMALSQEVMLRDKAFEKLLINDLRFPKFPWINLENELKQAMARHEVYNLASVERFIAKRQSWYDAVEYNPSIRKAWNRHCKKTRLNPNRLIFGYDEKRYGNAYYDKLRTYTVWEVIMIYAKLYFIYVIQSSLLISN